MHIETDGLVIREQNVGESDRLITVLTSKYGVIKAFVHGAKSMKSKLLSGTQLLCYSDFTFFRGRDAYTVDSANAKNVFFELRSDIYSLSIALYLAELAGELAPEMDDADELLRLTLNSIYLLSKGKKDRRLIKSVAELRAMSISGFMPNLVACDSCGEFKSDVFFFSIQHGNILCQNCNNGRPGVPLSFSTVTAMRHIVFSEPKKIFDFELTETAQNELSAITENFTLEQTGKHFKTLDFYKSL
ncbi:MAG: DNA repair protein RecO [Oscillospiraceae bacterium]|nr:DNA repair protein RecO [Oscillospiraceae bacterium]